MIEIWRHNKTGNLYIVEDTNAIDATNASDGERMVVYYKTTNQRFVRKYEEFINKFTRIGEGCAYPQSDI